ncbi:delta-60 repeat domain-containing protein [Nocardioides sp. TRM66260-LWL]|uniref:delta-60 repeat domain-containing protein n=1 Tax=Nocardioides sp. TRM66260-LWL TaxID=2874478 RepID=UPI001CC58183|nr:delta-60 repeat domain-containing protein [Nocardioides sp. TRM66260-LWL]MBZ5734954.1 delta-60 repeat domain-containing protein [Nocardioides sp. TRM66260-LWL]
MTRPAALPSPDAPDSPSGATAPTSASRRAVVAGAVWAAPTITVLSAAPAFATSGAGPTSISSVGGSGNRAASSGSVVLLLKPAPANPLPTSSAVVAYSDPGASTAGLQELSRTGTGATSAALYRLGFTTTTSPAPSAVSLQGTIAGYGAIPPTTVELGVAGTRDAAFAASLGNLVTAMAIQQDGSILVAGAFTTSTSPARNGLVRLRPDGSVDADFVTNLGGAFNKPSVLALAVQDDGSILVGGGFSTLGAFARKFILRLQPDGTPDPTFPAGTKRPEPNNAVQSIVVEPSGTILVGGQFTSFGGAAERLVRLRPDGTRDETFLPGTGAGFGSSVSAVLRQPDGMIIVAGSFLTFAGTSANRIVRLNTNGTRDADFVVGTGFDGGIGRVQCLALEADGSILAGGSFTSYDGAPAPSIARLSATGALDTAFSAAVGSDDTRLVNSIVVQEDGRILVGSQPTALGGGAAATLARLRSVGSADPAFGPGVGPDAQVTALVVQPDGRLVAGGAFTAYDGASAQRIVRVFT